MKPYGSKYPHKLCECPCCGPDKKQSKTVKRWKKAARRTAKKQIKKEKEE